MFEVGLILVYIRGMIKENIAPAKSHLSELVNRASSGEDVYICKNGVPVVRLVPVPSNQVGSVSRVIKELTVKIKGDIQSPLEKESWGELT